MATYCFYWKNASGFSGWLTREGVMEVMDSFIHYDQIKVSVQPDIERFDKTWYGIRLIATKDGKPERKIILDGEEETLKEIPAKHVDNFYYFKYSEIRDLVYEHWN